MKSEEAGFECVIWFQLAHLGCSGSKFSLAQY